MRNQWGKRLMDLLGEKFEIHVSLKSRSQHNVNVLTQTSQTFLLPQSVVNIHTIKQIFQFCKWDFLQL